jgi:hypothetical protein
VWPYFTVPLQGHTKQVWLLYLMLWQLSVLLKYKSREGKKRVWFENYHCHIVAIYTHYLHIVRAFIIFQVYQYFTACRRYFWLKFEQFSLISYTTLFKIRSYQRPFKVGKSTLYHPFLKGLYCVSTTICIMYMLSYLCNHYETQSLE